MTEFTDGQVTVKVVPCYKVIGNVIKRFKIEGTELFYNKEQIAIDKARLLFKEKIMSKDDFENMMDTKRRIVIARRIIRSNTCLKETEAFIKRWENIIYCENKKALLINVNESIKADCKLGKFRTPAAAIAFEKRNNPKNRKHASNNRKRRS